MAKFVSVRFQSGGKTRTRFRGTCCLSRVPQGSSSHASRRQTCADVDKGCTHDAMFHISACCNAGLARWPVEGPTAHTCSLQTRCAAGRSANFRRRPAVAGSVSVPECNLQLRRVGGAGNGLAVSSQSDGQSILALECQSSVARHQARFQKIPSQIVMGRRLSECIVPLFLAPTTRCLQSICSTPWTEE